jgi:hypothetical protein
MKRLSRSIERSPGQQGRALNVCRNRDRPMSPGAAGTLVGNKKVTAHENLRRMRTLRQFGYSGRGHQLTEYAGYLASITPVGFHVPDPGGRTDGGVSLG